MSDPRFARLKTDPRFRRPKHKQNKVVVDERFKSVFDEKKTKGKKPKARVDKYGRPLAENKERDDLRRFYRLEDDEGQEEAGPKPVLDYARGEVLLESSDEEGQNVEDSDDDGVVTLGLDHTTPIPVPRDEDEIDLDEDNFADLDAQASAALAAENDAAAIPATRRIAVVNLDWDHVRATHIYKIFSSLFALAPSAAPGKRSRIASNASVRGTVKSVKVYPSEFGKERMAREEKEGPPSEVFKKKRVIENEDEVNELNIYDIGDEEEVDEDALRKYQLERLRYYYAIIEFDTIEAAEYAFSELEGAELERSANVLDLSYVPENMTFDDEPRDTATSDSVGTYKPLDFTTDALRHSKVKLTWDEDDPERNRITRRALSKKEIEEADFKALIASSESESESDTQGAPTAAPAANRPQKSKRDAERDRMRALLLGDNAGADQLPEGWNAADGFDEKEKGKDVDVEITFMPGLSERKDAGDDETTLEAYRRKMREKRKKRKGEAKEHANEDAAPSLTAPADDFFGSDAESGVSDDESNARKGTKAKGKDKKGKDKRKSEPETTSRKASTAEELALLAAPDNIGDEPKHFDMKAVLKAEKKKGKKGKKKKAADGEPDELQEDFVMDVKDERFTALHEDHTFAIDPSNPHFKKTKGMSALLEERSKRRKHSEAKEPTAPSRAKNSTTDGDSEDRSLQKLVESVKRKSSALQTSGGKRQRT